MKNAKVKMNKSIYLAISILDISKTLMYEFLYDYIKPKYLIKIKQHCATWILTALLFILKPKIFLKTLLMMLKTGLTHLTTIKMTNVRNTDCLYNDKIILKSQQRFKSDYHNVCAEQINKIALSINDNKRLQTFDKITTYRYGTNAFKVCESEMLSKI